MSLLKYKKVCTVCKKEFVAKRKHATTCSAICRSQKATLNRVKIGEDGFVLELKEEIIEAATPTIVDNVLNTINDINKSNPTPKKLPVGTIRRCEICSSMFKDGVYLKINKEAGGINICQRCYDKLPKPK